MIFTSGNATLEVEDPFKEIARRVLDANPTLARPIREAAEEIRGSAVEKWPKLTGDTARSIGLAESISPDGISVAVGPTTPYARFIRFKGTRRLVWRALLALPGVKRGAQLAEELAEELAEVAGG